jgi:bifunctional enzyme CysN/CysC
MVTGASTADCAVILVDASKGVLPQTRRHSRIVALLGIRDVALAVNKMDMVGYDEHRFREIEQEYSPFAEQIELDRVTCVPVSALLGDNVFARSSRVRGYDGPTLMEYLDTVEVDQERMQDQPFRFPVQWVNRPVQEFRGYVGTVAAGSVRPGDEIIVLPSGRHSRADRIVTYEGDVARGGGGRGDHDHAM